MTKNNSTLKHSIKIGDVVKLDEKSLFLPSRSNPRIGTMFECSGVVIDDGTVTGSIQVKWDNGAVNLYINSDLVVLKQEEYNSIW